MRSLVFLCLIFAHISFFLPAQETTVFTPLADNERFAFYSFSVPLSPAIHRPDITVFAVRDNNVNDISALFTWENVRFNNAQFAHDFKKCFFLVDASPYLLYRANGFTGEIKKVLALNNGNWRVSNNGRFVLFLGNSVVRLPFAHLLIFDVENEAIVGEFEWRPEIDPMFGEVFWEVARFDDIFRIYAIDELSYITAVAEIDPETMILRTLWNDYRTVGLPSRPSYNHDLKWVDDIRLQTSNPTVFLQQIDGNN